MKQKLVTLLAFTAIANFAFAQNITIPDANFKNYLLSHPLINTNNDNKISVEEAEGFTGSINIDAYGDSNFTVYSLEGIQYFKNITGIRCYTKSMLKNIDLSGNNALKEIELGFYFVSSDPFIVLGFKNNIALEKLEIKDFNASRISGIDLTTNTNLTDLILRLNNTHADTSFDLDLSKNTNLKNLYIISSCFKNSLDLSENTALEKLHLENVRYKVNQSCQKIDNLDLSNNLSLTYLSCNNHNLTSLDLSNNKALTTLDCSSNQLTGLNLKNGNNTNFSSFNATENSDLNCIQVDNEEYSTANWPNIDSQTSFSEDCQAFLTINDNTIENNISFYPNPVNDVLHFSSNQTIENVIVSNILGQQVNVSLSSDKTSLDFSKLTNGNYLVKITIEGVSKTINIVKK